MRDDEAAGPGVISVATTAAYLVPVLMVAVFMGEPWQQPAHWAAVVAVLLGSAYVGGSRALGVGLTAPCRPGCGVCHAPWSAPSWSCSPPAQRCW